MPNFVSLQLLAMFGTLKSCLYHAHCASESHLFLTHSPLDVDSH